MRAITPRLRRRADEESRASLLERKHRVFALLEEELLAMRAE